MIVYEPALKESKFFNSRVVNDLTQIQQEADVIVAIRMTEQLKEVGEKVYSRDLFGQDCAADTRATSALWGLL